MQKAPYSLEKNDSLEKILTPLITGINALKKDLFSYSSSKNSVIEYQINTIETIINSLRRDFKENTTFYSLCSEFDELRDTYNCKAGKGVYESVNKALSSASTLTNMFREQTTRNLSEIRKYDENIYSQMTHTAADIDPILERRITGELPTAPSIFSIALSYASQLNIFSSCMVFFPSNTQDHLNADSKRFTQHADSLKNPVMQDDEPTQEEIDAVIDELGIDKMKI